MIFLYMILFIFPGIIATGIYLKISKKDNSISIFNNLFYIALFSFIITFLDILLLLIKNQIRFNFNNLTIQFLVKYLFVSGIFCIIIPFVYHYIINFFFARNNKRE